MSPDEEAGTMSEEEVEALFSSPSFLLSVAAETRRVARFRYTDLHGNVTEAREVEPIAIYRSAGVTFLIGWCRVRAAPRHFNVARISRLEILDERFEDRRYHLKTEVEEHDPRFFSRRSRYQI